MAPKKLTLKSAVAATTEPETPQPPPATDGPRAEAAAPEIVPAAAEIEEIVPETGSYGLNDGLNDEITFILGSEAPPLLEDDEFDDADDADGEDDADDADGEDDEEEDEEDDHHAAELVTVVGQVAQLMMTEEGEAITDVLHGIKEAMDKQNKIMYRALQLLEQRFAKRP
jgi:hypothetical protein